jgi:hypothetical protein
MTLITGCRIPSKTCGSTVNVSTDHLPTKLQEAFSDALAKLIKAPAEKFGDGVFTPKESSNAPEAALASSGMPSAPLPSSLKFTI